MRVSYQVFLSNLTEKLKRAVGQLCALTNVQYALFVAVLPAVPELPRLALFLFGLFIAEHQHDHRLFNVKTKRNKLATIDQH